MSQLLKNIKSTVIKAQQGAQTNQDAPARSLSATSDGQQVKQGMQQGQQQVKPVQRKIPAIGRTSSQKSPFTSQRITSNTQKIEYIRPKTSYQQLRAVAEPQKKWYKGDMPTVSEAAARIYTISQTAPEEGQRLYGELMRFQSDPSTPFYNPYATATNKAVQELAALGFDVSGGVTEDWLAQNSWLKGYYRTTGASNTPQAPTKSSSAEQNAAYWYYKLLSAQETTDKANAEWEALKEEVGYWANRTDRNYSDEEILQKIDWSNYGTLVRMDEGRDNGVPLTLNSANGYSQDALKGVIWAARNGSTGDALADSAKAVLGAGKSWAENKTLRAKLDPASESYSPYSAGSTLDDAALYFGVQSFGKDWLEKNRELLSGDDATAKKMYQAVYNAEQTTQKAEAELADLRASIDRYMQTTSDPDAIMRRIDGEYATLESMEESLKTGKLLDTTRAVDYRRQDIEAEVRRRCLEKNTQVEVPEFVVTLRRLLGLPAMSTESGTAVDASRDNAINAGGATIADAGTQEEKVVFGTAYSSNFDAYLTQIKDAMDSGIDNPQAGYDYTLERATKYAAGNYIDARSTIENYEAAQDARDEAVKRLAEMGIVYEDGNLDMTNRKSALPELTGTASASAGTGDAPRKLRKASDDTADEIDMLRKEIASGYGKDEKGKRVKLTDAELDAKKSELQALIHPETVSASQKEINTLLDVIDESEETLADTQKAYDKAVKTMRNIEDGYAVASRMQQLTGAKSGDERSTLAQMDYLFAIGKDYEPTQWRSANLYATAMDEYGATYEQTAAAAKQGMAQNKKQIEQIDFALSELEAKGAHLPEAYAENIARCRAALVRDVQDAEYFLVRENKDYYSETRSVSEAVFAAWKDYNELNPLGMLKNVFSDRGGYSALDNAVAIRLEQLEMEEASAALGQDLKSDKVIMASGNPNQDGYYSEDISQLNKNECMTYLYLRGKEGDAAAKAYYDHLTNSEYGVINMRRNLDLTEKAAAFADENALTGTLASVLSVIASPLNIGGPVESVKADLSGKEMNPYARGFVYGSMNSTARGTVKENIVNSVDNEAAGWLLGALYNAVMSYGDSMVSSYFMGGLGSAAGSGAGKLLAKTGLTENYVNLASNVVSSFVTASGQGMQAVGNAMMDAKLRGATPAEARVLGLVTFLAETVTEAIEVETIDSAIHGGAEREFKDTFKKLLFNMFNEGAGEGVSELVEGVADKVVMDYKSNWVESVQRYIDEGMTKKQAEDAAWKEIMWNAAEAAAVGGISGGLGTGLGYVQGRIFGDGSQTQDAVQPTAETVQQTAQETVQDVQQEQTAQDAQNAEAQNVAPAAAETITAPNAVQETQTTNNEDSGKIAQQVTALTAALDADESSRTATIGAALIGENANAQATAIASAAAQHLADMLGSDAAVRFTRDVLLLDSDTNGVRAALTVAALDRSGRANQVITQLAQDGVTAEGVAQLKAAADADMQNANASANIQQAAIENQVARRTAELIGDGGLKAVQPYETAVAQKRSELRQAQGDLHRQQNRREELGKNLLTLQDNINSGTATPQLLDTFRQTVKDIEGQIKVVAEYEQRASNAEQGLQDARNQLASVRDEALRQVRQQAQQDVMSTWEAQAEQAETQENPGYQKKQFIPYEGPVPQAVENVQQDTVTIDDASYAQVQQIVEDAQADAETKSGVRSLVKSALRAVFGSRLDGMQVTVDNVQFDGQPYTVTLFKSLINKVVSDPSMTVEKLSVLSSVEQVVKNAAYIESSDVDRSKQKKSKVVRYDYLSTPIQIEGSAYDVKLTIEVYDNLNKAKTYMLTDMKMTPSDSLPPTGHVPARTGDGSLLPTGHVPAAQSKASSSTNILASDAENVNTENNSNGNQSLRFAYGQNGIDVPSASSETAANVVNPIDTAKELAKALGVEAYLGTKKMTAGKKRLPKAVRGFYDQSIKYIATRAGQAADYAVSMHEIGHAIADKLSMTGTQSMVDQMNQAFKGSYSAVELPHEAFAEFVRLYMTDSRAAENFAGSEFVRDFERGLRAKEIAAPVHQARDRMQAYIAASTLERAKSAIVDQADAWRRNSLGEKLRDIVTQTLDWTRPLEDVDKATAKSNGGEYGNVRTMAKRRNFADRIVNNLFENALTDAQGTIIGDSFSAAFEGVDGREANDFIAYGLLKHSLYRDEQHKQVFANDLTQSQREAEVIRIEEAHPEYLTAMENFESTWNKFMQAWMVDTGFLGQEQFDQMRTMYPFWLPTKRVMDGKSGTGQRDTFTIKGAKGSDLKIVNPIDSIASYVTQIVDMNLKNGAALAFSDAYQANSEGMKVWAREVTQDMRRVAVNTEDVQKKVADILQQNDASEDVIENVLDAIGKEAVDWIGMKGSSEGNVLRVVNEDGTNAYYQFTPDGEAIYKALSGNGKAANQDVRSAMRFFSRLTSFMSKMATTYAPTFMASNPIKDIQNSINYGSWATTTLDGLAKWVRSAYEVALNKGAYSAYKAMGGGGWNSIQTGYRAGADEYRNKLFNNYWRSSTKGKIDHAKGVVMDVVTLEKLNDIIENTSRYAEYRFGKHDITTPEGRMEAFQAAQDVTTDFANGGNGTAVLIARSIVPFLNPNLQGTYRAARELTGRERGRLAARMTKRLVNYAMTAGIAKALRDLLGDDEQKEVYKNLSDEVKTSNIVIPNGSEGADRRFWRIPVSQDPYDQLFHTFFTSAVDHLSGDDDFATELLAGCKQIVSNITVGLSDVLEPGTTSERMNGLMSSTVFGPLWGLATNQNYYGKAIVSDYLNDLSPALQYDETTGSMFIALGQALGVSPKKIEYLYNQYTGYGGQLLVSITDGGNALKTTTAAFHKRFTIDPAYTNDIVSAYSQNNSFFEQLLDNVKRTGTDGKMLRSGLTADERAKAYEEAKSLTAKSGLLGDTNTQISELWRKVREVQNDSAKTDEERNVLILAYRDQMTDLQLTANEQLGDYFARYVTGDNPLTKWLLSPQEVTPYSDYDKLDETFKADAEMPYMTMAHDVWEQTQNKSALPHPNTSFSNKGVTYEIDEANWEAYTAEYKLAYADYLNKFAAKWDTMSEDDKVEALKSAHTSGHNAAKKWYMATHNIK